MITSALLGAVGYPALEMLWRGRTHWSMAIAGGMGSCLIAITSRLKAGRGTKALLCALGITAIEFGTGLMVNRRYEVWDDRRVPGNIKGQICLPYMALWYGLSLCYLFALEEMKRIRDSQ